MEIEIVKFYLDTNIIYNLGKIPNELISKSFISCLGIFEVISGINNESSYKRRRGVIKKIIDSKIEVLWELPKTIIEREFSYPIDYSDVYATEIMMRSIYNHEKYSDLKAISFIVDGKEYSMSTFIEYDDFFSLETTKLFNGCKVEGRNEIDELEKEIFFSSEMIIANFISSRGSEFERPSKKYFEVLEKYMRTQKLDKYIRCISAYLNLKFNLGKVSGKNDGFDIGHIAYMHDVDYFVSNDKIYNEPLSKYAGITTLSYEEYIEKA